MPFSFMIGRFESWMKYFFAFSAFIFLLFTLHINKKNRPPYFYSIFEFNR